MKRKPWHTKGIYRHSACMQSPYMQGLALTRKMNHTYNTNTRTNRISQTSIPLNTSGERKTEKERERGKK